MDSTQDEPKNPLGLSLDFMFGRGYLWAQRQRLNDWIALESLRMEIPDLQFPFDARGGLQRFRHTRCLVREVEFAISEVGLGDLLTEALSHLEGFEQLEVRFLEDAAQVSLKLKSLGANTFISFRAALIPPEPARADEVHLSFYDYRAYGPLPYPARLVVYELLTSILDTPVFHASGRGESFSVGVAGDIVSFRPLKLLFLHLFPRVGWKLPNLSGVVLESARIRPGVMTIRAVDADPQAGRLEAEPTSQLSTTKEGSRALAAYEAKELFAHADQALFDGQLRQALSLLENYRDTYGLHPALVARHLDCLLADPSPANLAEAESIRRELVAEDESDLQAALVAPIIARARRRSDEATEAFEALSKRLQKEKQTPDWILSELALTELIAAENPERAVRRLRKVLKRSPRQRAVLERLRNLYERLGEKAALEETLKRLTGVYTDRETLKRTYLELARHLMDREGDLGEARMYLEKVLRLDGTELEALHILGESYVLGGEPLRALKAFGSAARAAESEGLEVQASRLHHRVGELWYGELEDPRQALLEFRRAIALGNDRSDEELGAMHRVEQLGRAAEMCEELSRDDEAIEYWAEALQILEKQMERRDRDFSKENSRTATGETVEELLRAHRRLGMVYDRRKRYETAESHFRRILEIRPVDEVSLDWMEKHLQQAGRPDELLQLYRELLRDVQSRGQRLKLHEKMGDLFTAAERIDEALGRYRSVLNVDPGRRGVLRKLVALLTKNERYGALRDVLNTVMVRTTDSPARQEISMELGRVNEAMGEPLLAAQAYLEAVKLDASDLEALEAAGRVLEAYVESEGVDAKAPIGDETAGQLLEKLLIRRAELVPSIVEQRQVLLQVASIAEQRGDSAAAAEASERAEALVSKTDPGGVGDDVDSRLDAMLEELVDGPSVEVGPIVANEGGEAETTEHEKIGEARPPGMAEAESDTDLGPTTAEDVRTVMLPTPKGYESAGPDEITEAEEEDSEAQRLSSFRRRFASMIKEPAELPGQDSTQSEVDETERKARLKKLLHRARTKKDVDRRGASGGDAQKAEVRDSADSKGFSKKAGSSKRGTRKTPRRRAPETTEVEQIPAVGEKKEPRENLSTGERGEPENGGGWSFKFGGELGMEESSEPRGLDGASVGLDEESQIDTSPQINPVELALKALDEARNSGDKAQIAEAAEDVLSLTNDGESPLLKKREVISLSRELGEILYYDLEEEKRALPHLERVRRLDPKGQGSETAVINALQAMYEQRGDLESRIALLEERLDATESAEMATTYRLLLAQLVWEQTGDAAEARGWLDEVLDTDGDHEGAHRLLAEIAGEQKDWRTAARHLEVSVRVSGEGIDAVENRRKLADLYLRKLDDPQRAQSHYELVLREAPGDAQALEGIKESQASQRDWQGYVESLGRELGLLLGRREGVKRSEWLEMEPSEVASALRVPASQIVADAAQIVEEELSGDEEARQLWGLAYRLWPEHVEALQRRIELDRKSGHSEALAEDLEAYAAMMLDRQARFDLLVEAAKLRADELDDPEGATLLYAEAIAVVEGSDDPPRGLDAARRALKRLQAAREWQ